MLRSPWKSGLPWEVNQAAFLRPFRRAFKGFTTLRTDHFSTAFSHSTSHRVLAHYSKTRNIRFFIKLIIEMIHMEYTRIPMISFLQYCTLYVYLYLLVLTPRHHPFYSALSMFILLISMAQKFMPHVVQYNQIHTAIIIKRVFRHNSG